MGIYLHESRLHVLEATGPRAHHSHGNYDMTTYTNLKGTIKDVHWINPHTSIFD